MLFNSYPFIFAFLPVTLAGFFWVGRRSGTAAAAWLALASLFFYGWWNPIYVVLLVGSILFNYAVGVAIVKADPAMFARRKRLLTAGIGVDLALLAYFKYANFFLDNLNTVLGSAISLGTIILPLGISFFTFTQIAFLVDAYQGKAREYRFVHYGLFVTYFPHLIAGPILHHGEMMPQFGLPDTYRVNWDKLAAGITMFVIGLFKKVMLADGIAVYVIPIFHAARDGIALTFWEGWCGALAYSFQLYFDFSGYSDMAVGLSLMFGVRLPINFHSPYKAVNIIEFWRRWHMTLSRFLRDYLYFPLGGNRRGPARRYANLMATMLLGGLWHGAGWTFVLWGGLHGVYLVINHAWRALRQILGQDTGRATPWGRAASRLLTFLAVVIAFTVFRAESFESALAMLRAMAGMNSFALPDFWFAKWGSLGTWLAAHGAQFTAASGLVTTGLVYWVVILLAVVWSAPNSQQILSRFEPALNIPLEPVTWRWLRWNPTHAYAMFVAALALVCVINLHQKSEFLYFQF